MTTIERTKAGIIYLLGKIKLLDFILLLYRIITVLLIHLFVYQIIFDIKIDGKRQANKQIITINKFYILDNNQSIDRLHEIIGTGAQKISFKYNNYIFEISFKETIVRINGVEQEVELGDISLDGMLLVRTR